MKLSMPLVYAGNPRETADQVSGLEKAGLDGVWVAEPYGFEEEPGGTIATLEDPDGNYFQLMTPMGM